MEPNYIGVDLHKAFFQACAATSTGSRVWEGRFPRTAEGIAQFCARCSATSRIAVEACGPTWPFVDVIEPTGATIVKDKRQCSQREARKRATSTSKPMTRGSLPAPACL